MKIRLPPQLQKEYERLKKAVFIRGRIRKRQEGKEPSGEEDEFFQKMARVKEEVEEEEAGSALALLPPEVLETLLRYLPMDDLFNVRQVERFLELPGSEVLLQSSTFTIPEDAEKELGTEEYVRVITKMGPMVRSLKIVDNNPIHIARHFPNLWHLTLGSAYQRPLTRETVPRTLVGIWIGNNYMPKWEKGALPEGLRLFSVGNKPMYAVPKGYLPESVRVCFLGDANRFQRISSLPRRLDSLFVHSYTRRLEVGDLPPTLERFLWHGCNQALTLELLPRALETLAIRGTITDTIPARAFPESLKSLIIHGDVAGHFREGVLPSRLEILHLGMLVFRQMFTPETLPRTLTELVLGTNYNQPFAPGVLPPTLTWLSLGRQYDFPLTRANLPARLKFLTINSGEAQILYLPGARYSHSYNDLPDSIEHLHIELNEHDIERLPRNLRTLTIMVVRTRPGLGDINFEHPIQLDTFKMLHVARAYHGLPW